MIDGHKMKHRERLFEWASLIKGIGSDECRTDRPLWEYSRYWVFRVQVPEQTEKKAELVGKHNIEALGTAVKNFTLLPQYKMRPQSRVLHYSPNSDFLHVPCQVRPIYSDWTPCQHNGPFPLLVEQRNTCLVLTLKTFLLPVALEHSAFMKLSVNFCSVSLVNGKQDSLQYALKSRRCCRGLESIQNFGC